jgi:hypothetical protein
MGEWVWDVGLIFPLRIGHMCARMAVKSAWYENGQGALPGYSRRGARERRV